MRKISVIINKIKHQIKSKPNVAASVIVFAALLVSRALGLLRQILVLNRMDANIADLFVASLFIPDTITAVLIIGTIISSVLPVITRIEKNKPELAAAYLNWFTYIMCGLILLISLIGAILTEQLLKVTGYETWLRFANDGLSDQYVYLSRIFLIGPFFFTLTAILGLFLQLKRRFLIYSLSGIFYNIAGILPLLLFGRNPYVEVAVGHMFGVFITILVYYIDARKQGWRTVHLKVLTAQWPKVKQDIILTWKALLPRLFLFEAVFIATFLLRNLNTSNGDLISFDIGLAVQSGLFIVITSLDTVFFPKLSQLFQDKINPNAFWSELKRVVLGVGCISLVVCMFTNILAVNIEPILLFFGKDVSNIRSIILVAQVSSVALIFNSLKLIIGKYFFIHERIWQPVVLSVAAISLQIVSSTIMDQFELMPLVNVSLSLSIYGLVWLMVAYYFIWQDRQKMPAATAL
jgi:putative peptidoglycan lipid II flippase